MINPLNDDMDIIAALDDEPNDENGLTPAQAKAKFDEAGNRIKTYVNGSLIPDIGAEIESAVSASELHSGNIPTGGAAGQVLMKNSGANYDYGWRNGESAPAALTVMGRDASGRAQVADPAAAGDIATKNYVDKGQPVGTVRLAGANPWGVSGFLCNGAVFDPTVYSALAPMTAPASPPLAPTWDTRTLPASSNGNLGTDGVYVAFSNSTGNVIYYIAVSGPAGLSCGGPFMSVTLTGASCISDIKYANGYWVVCDNSTGKLYYAASLTGTWTLAATLAYLTMGLKYVNNMWIALCRGGRIYYAASPNGAWTTAIVGNQSYPVYDIAYGNGYYVVTQSQLAIYYATSLTGTWASVNVSYNTTHVDFGAGYFMSAYGYYNEFIYTATPTSWTQITIPGGDGDIFIRYVNGYWALFNTGVCFYYGVSPTSMTFSASVTQGKETVCANGVWISTYSNCVVYTTGYHLPVVSVGVNAYIKAL